MPPDKDNLIMAIATGLISSLYNVASTQDVPFLQLQQLQCLATWFYQSLPLFSLELHSSLHYCVGDDLRYAHYDFSARLSKHISERIGQANRGYAWSIYWKKKWSNWFESRRAQEFLTVNDYRESHTQVWVAHTARTVTHHLVYGQVSLAQQLFFADRGINW